MFKVESLAPMLQVFDMPRAVVFYRDVLEFEVVATSPARSNDDSDWGLLRRDGMELMLNASYEHDERPAAPDPARIAAHDDTAIFFACRELDAIYAHLRAHGVEANEPAVAYYGMKQIWLKGSRRLCDLLSVARR